MVEQRGTLTYLVDDHIAFHHDGTGADYAAELLDEETAENIRIYIMQCNGGYDDGVATPEHISLCSVGQIVGSDGNVYDVIDKNRLPEGVTAVGVIACRTVADGEVKGLILALTDELTEFSWDDACGERGAAAHKPTINGYQWKLPSRSEWEQMLTACGGSASNWRGISNKLVAIGGTPLQNNRYYWTSTEDGNKAWLLATSHGGNGYFTSLSKSQTKYRARSCVAF
jgi:hypothetical protein